MSANWKHFGSLYFQLVKRQVTASYRGTVLGFGWSFVHPLLMLAVYTFVFSVVFKTRWPMPEGQPQGMFAIILFTGLMVHGLAATILTQSVNSISGNVNYVKKIIFPLPLLPLVPVGAALFNFGFSLLILLVAKLVMTGELYLTTLWLPVILLPYLIALAGVGLMLAAFGVYLRDIGQIIGLITMMLLFLSPIFYPAEALPESFQFILAFNPLTLIITQTRNVILWGQSPELMPLLIYGALACVVFAIGYGLFTRLKRGFADVL